MELTKEYFDQQLSQLATKTDIKAVNERIHSLPTQADLELFATKDDLLELATKTDLSALRSDIAEVKTAIESLKQTEDEDVRGALRDISSIKKRVSALERPVANR